MEPPLYNLVPEPLDTAEHDTPELLAHARSIAERTKSNLFCSMYGTNPLNIADPSLLITWFPWHKYSAPQPLPEVTMSEKLHVCEQLNATGNPLLFLVEHGGQKMLLKVFPDRDALQDDENDDGEEDTWGRYTRKPDLRVLFQRECNAYAHLLHFGVCKRGTVPHCYGWATLSSRDVGKLVALPLVSDVVRALSSEERPPKDILIEYFANAERLSYRNITSEIAQVALRALHAINAANVIHGDVHRRNILLLPDKRVIWIDFDCSSCVSSGHLMRQDFLRELRDAWSYMYEELLPDKRIGYNYL